MRAILATLLLLSLSFGMSARAEECPVAGESVQWIADYCMFKSQTDDLEAVMPCIEMFTRRQFESHCAAKLHFKRLLCENILPSDFLPYESVEQCVNDPEFAGRIVSLPDFKAVASSP